MQNSTRKVENVWIAGQSIRPFGDGTALAITCAMPVAFTTRWTGWTGHWSSSLADWYLILNYYFLHSVINTLYMLCIKHPQWRGDAAAILIFAKAGFPRLVDGSTNSFVCVPVAAEPGHGGVSDYYKNFYSQGYNGAKRAPFQTTEEKSSRRLVGFKKRASLSPSFLKQYSADASMRLLSSFSFHPLILKQHLFAYLLLVPITYVPLSHLLLRRSSAMAPSYPSREQFRFVFVQLNDVFQHLFAGLYCSWYCMLCIALGAWLSSA